MKTKENETKIVCPICNKPVKSSFGLQGHMKTHKAAVAAEIKDMPVLDVTAPVSDSPEWIKRNGKKKADVTRCIVIDKNNRWHENAKVRLGDVDPLPFTWGYYGGRYPVLAEKDNKLVPYDHSDIVGESCSLLYKMGHPDGFKNVFKHIIAVMQKIQIGLMAAIVLGIFGLIYVLINR